MIVFRNDLILEYEDERANVLQRHIGALVKGTEPK